MRSGDEARETLRAVVAQRAGELAPEGSGPTIEAFVPRGEAQRPLQGTEAGYFRNNYYYPYGDTLCNLDEKLYQQLDPTVRQLFAPFFTETDPRYWKLRQDPGIRV